jgi:hypothetical protein
MRGVNALQGAAILLNPFLRVSKACWCSFALGSECGTPFFSQSCRGRAMTLKLGP